MPTSAEIHIQKMAPGPPAVIAVATPTMLPVPMVADSAVHKAPNWLMSPGASGSFVTDSLMAVGSLRWMKPVRKVKKDVRPQQQHEHRRPPNEGVDAVDDVNDHVHVAVLLSVSHVAGL